MPLGIGLVVCVGAKSLCEKGRSLPFWVTDLFQRLHHHKPKQANRIVGIRKGAPQRRAFLIYSTSCLCWIISDKCIKRGSLSNLNFIYQFE